MKAIILVFLTSYLLMFNLYAQESKTVTELDVIKNIKKDSKDKEKTPAKNGSEEVKLIKIDKSEAPTIKRRTPDEKYRIGFQDVLTVNVFNVFGQPKISQTVGVSSDGTILLPRISEPIVAVCKTERELAKLVTEYYKNYLRSPFVNVRTLEQRSQPFAVVGAVKKPGNFYLKEKVRLLRLISLAGGQDVEFSGSRIQVARFGNAAGCSATTDEDSDYQFFAYSLNDVLTGKENPWLQPGDIVSVLEAAESYVIGDVFKPTKVLLKEPKTLTEALAEAGGVSSTAKTSRVVIQRKAKGGITRKELIFDLKEIQANKISDPILQPNDIVVVTSSKTKQFKKGMWDLLKTTLPTVFYRF